jgi:hypothetical protein
MSCNLRLCDGRTVAVHEDVSEVMVILDTYAAGSFYTFSMGDTSNGKRRIRLSAIIEYGQGHSK